MKTNAEFAYLVLTASDYDTTSASVIGHKSLPTLQTSRRPITMPFSKTPSTFLETPSTCLEKHLKDDSRATSHTGSTLSNCASIYPLNVRDYLASCLLGRFATDSSSLLLLCCVFPQLDKFYLHPLVIGLTPKEFIARFSDEHTFLNFLKHTVLLSNAVTTALLTEKFFKPLALADSAIKIFNAKIHCV